MSRLSIYLFFLISACALGFAKFIVFAQFLDASDFGFYNLVLTTQVLIVYASSLGANESMLKLGSTFHGKQQRIRTDEVRVAALFYGCLSVGIFGLILTFLSYALLAADTSKIIGYASLLAVFVFIYQIFDAFFRSTQQIIVFSSAHFARSLLTLTIGFYLAKDYGAKGIVFAELFSAFIITIYFIHLSEWKGCQLNLNRWRTDISMLLNNGISLLSSSFLRYSTIAIDRWAITASLGLDVWGKYSFIMILFQVGTIIVGLFGNIMGPRWIADYSNTADSDTVTKSIKAVSAVIFVTSLALFIGLYGFLPGVMENHFAGYYFDSFFDVLVLVYFGVVFFCINCFVDWYFICVSREGVLVKISTLSLMGTVFGTWFLIANSWTLIGFAVLFFCIRGASLAFTVIAVYKHKAVFSLSKNDA